MYESTDTIQSSRLLLLQGIDYCDAQYSLCVTLNLSWHYITLNTHDNWMAQNSIHDAAQPSTLCAPQTLVEERLTLTFIHNFSLQQRL